MFELEASVEIIFKKLSDLLKNVWGLFDFLTIHSNWVY